ncbi:hypothetical protein [Roseivivax sp. CAU 1753]
MKILTILQALILIGLTVYGASHTEVKPRQSLSCAPAASACPSPGPRRTS